MLFANDQLRSISDNYTGVWESPEKVKSVYDLQQTHTHTCTKKTSYSFC